MPAAWECPGQPTTTMIVPRHDGPVRVAKKHKFVTNGVMTVCEFCGRSPIPPSA